MAGTAGDLLNRKVYPTSDATPISACFVFPVANTIPAVLAVGCGCPLLNRAVCSAACKDLTQHPMSFDVCGLAFSLANYVSCHAGGGGPGGTMCIRLNRAANKDLVRPPMVMVGTPSSILLGQGPVPQR